MTLSQVSVHVGTGLSVEDVMHVQASLQRLHSEVVKVRTRTQYIQGYF